MGQKEKGNLYPKLAEFSGIGSKIHVNYHLFGNLGQSSNTF